MLLTGQETITKQEISMRINGNVIKRGIGIYVSFLMV